MAKNRSISEDMLRILNKPTSEGRQEKIETALIGWVKEWREEIFHIIDDMRKATNERNVKKEMECIDRLCLLTNRKSSALCTAISRLAMPSKTTFPIHIKMSEAELQKALGKKTLGVDFEKKAKEGILNEYQ